MDENAKRTISSNASVDAAIARCRRLLSPEWVTVDRHIDIEDEERREERIVVQKQKMVPELATEPVTAAFLRGGFQLAGYASRRHRPPTIHSGRAWMDLYIVGFSPDDTSCAPIQRVFDSLLDKSAAAVPAEKPVLGRESFGVLCEGVHEAIELWRVADLPPPLAAVRRACMVKGVGEVLPSEKSEGVLATGAFREAMAMNEALLEDLVVRMRYSNVDLSSPCSQFQDLKRAQFQLRHERIVNGYIPFLRKYLVQRERYPILFGLFSLGTIQRATFHAALSSMTQEMTLNYAIFMPPGGAEGR